MSISNQIERTLASTALKLMETHSVPPIPENYTVWYHYASGRNTLLNEDVNKIIEQSMPFSTQVMASLYQRHFVTNKNQKMVDDTAANAQQMLKNILKAVNDFSGETKHYNQGLDEYIETISKDYGDTDVHNVVKELLGATGSLKARGEHMNAKLEESKLEIDNLRRNLQQVTSEAQKDGLTGLFNRKTFERILDEYMQEAQDNNHDLCLLMLDVDHFKKFNDTYGHLLGDEVLKIVARTLTDTLKGRDVVARFGGEEFVVFLPETPIEGALRVADTIRQSIASKELKRRDTGENFGRITVSVGVSRYRHGVDDIPALVKRADDALYESKRLGRNRVTRES